MLPTGSAEHVLQADRIETEPAVEILRPVAVVGDEEHEFGPGTLSFCDSVEHDGSGEPTVSVPRQRGDILDLGDASSR